LPSGLPDDRSIGRGLGNGVIARSNRKIGIAQFDTYRAPLQTTTLQIISHTLTQVGKNVAQLGLIAHWVQVALESGFAAQANWLALGHHRAVVTPPG
jgi:hypothetical protein